MSWSYSDRPSYHTTRQASKPKGKPSGFSVIPPGLQFTSENPVFVKPGQISCKIPYPAAGEGGLEGTTKTRTEREAVQ
jgi:hypothetical protein